MKNVQYHVVGVSHIDMAFLMREEAHEEMLDILLARAVEILERNPELHFALEQAAHYKKLEKRRPDLFEKVKKLLTEGRMEFMGGMATTAETNFPNGECLVRNQGMGLRWVEEHLGVRPESAWLVDTFGMNAQIPQIMKQFGMKDLHASRFGGDKRYDLFLGEGLDGSRIRILGREGYGLNVLPDTQAMVFCRNVTDVDHLFAAADALQSPLPRLVVYYLENEEIYSEYYVKLVKERRESGGDWKHSTYREYREALDAAGCELPVLFCDMNPEFTGTYALRTPLRTANRKAETSLLTAEKWMAMFCGKTLPELDECWWELFFCQFHDVFSGSHEDITYKRTMDGFHRICDTSVRVLKGLMRTETQRNQFVCLNGLPWARTEWVRLEDEECGHVSEKGEPVICVGEDRVPTVRREDGLYFLAQLPAGGVREYTLRREEAVSATQEQNASADMGSKDREIRNEYLHLVLSEREGIERLEDMHGNCFMEHAADFLVAEEDRGGLQIEEATGRTIYALTGTVQISDVVKNSMEECITMSGTFPDMPWNEGRNRLNWKVDFSLRKGEKALRMKVTVDWHGEETRIRLKVQSCMYGRDAFYEIPFGVVRREAYRNRPTAKGEWPAHRFTALEDGQKGIALINSGVAGVEQEGAALVTTLIRAYGNSDQVWIKPSELTSQYGVQSFDFMLAPYMGNYREAGVIRMAQAFNAPIAVCHGRSPLEEEASLYEIGERNLVLSAIKMAWDNSDELVIRIYESEGVQTRGTIRIHLMKEAWLSDMSEKKGDAIPVSEDILTADFTPYEIKTFRIRRA